MTDSNPPPFRTNRWYSILGFQFSRKQALHGAAILSVGCLAFAIAFAAWYVPPRATSRLIRSVGGYVSYRPEQMSNFPFARFLHSQSQLFGFTTTDEEVDFVQLTQSNVTDAWLHHLQPLEELRHLSIHERQLGPGLADLANCETLAAVSLWHPCSCDLAHLNLLPNLTTVTLVQNTCPDIDLNKLTLMPRLTSLGFSSATVTARQLDQITQIKTLTSLNLSFVKLDASGNEALRHLAMMPKLQILTISGATDETANVLADVLANTESLTYLGVMHSSLTDTGAAALPKIRNLRDLNLSGCDNHLNIQVLQKQMPQCRINYSYSPHSKR